MTRGEILAMLTLVAAAAAAAEASAETSAHGDIWVRASMRSSSFEGSLKKRSHEQHNN